MLSRASSCCGFDHVPAITLNSQTLLSPSGRVVHLNTTTHEIGIRPRLSSSCLDLQESSQIFRICITSIRECRKFPFETMQTTVRASYKVIKIHLIEQVLIFRFDRFRGRSIVAPCPGSGTTSVIAIYPRPRVTMHSGCVFS